MNNTMKNARSESIGALKGRSGFSLVELMVVLVILGALAAAVGIYINTADSRLKTFVFNQKAKFTLARMEAVKRGRDVYIDFDFLPVATNGDGNIDNGYTIWVDENNDETFDAGEELESVVFDNIMNPAYGHHGPEIYVPATGGGDPPDVNGGPDNKNIGHGVTAAGDRFRFSPDGSARTGSLYLYFPEGPAGNKNVAAGPWVIIVNNAGRIRLDRWNHMKPMDWDVDK